MTTLVISDIHENIEQVKRIQDQAKADLTVFTGDWLDRWPNQAGNLEDTLRYLYDYVEDSDKLFIMGNHDAPYMYPYSYLRCSGHQHSKRGVICAVMQSSRVIEKFNLYHEVDGYLLSHAGLHPKFARFNWKDQAEQAMVALKRGDVHYLVNVGPARGGMSQAVGGMTWLDWDDEFEPVEGIKQIVGHTTHKEPVWKDGNLGLDTRLQHYALIEGGVLTVHEVI